MIKSSDKIFLEEMEGHAEVYPIISLDERPSDGEFQLDAGETLPILPLRNMVIFPGVLSPVAVARPKSLKLIREAQENNAVIGVCTQIDAHTEDPGGAELYTMGTAAQIVRVLEMPDNSTTVILEGKKRFRLGEVVKEKPYMRAHVALCDDVRAEAKDDEVFQALVSSVKDLATSVIAKSGSMPPETVFAIRNIENPVFLINYVCSNMPFDVKDKQALLEQDVLMERGYQLLELLNKESQLIDLKLSIQNKAKEGIDQQQREYFLQQQMKTIQHELGDAAELDLNELKEKAKTKKWGEAVAKAFDKELKRLERMHPHSPDYPTQLNYIETMLDLPWNEYTKDNFNLKNAKKVLDADHFGMDTVKERILEHLAVLKLRGDMKSPIICLYGPPGVGKTSLGRSIATALKRKYVRVSLGGLHDEAEIRGHRRTYIGALPGRIIQNIQKAESANPVFVLDEIDKISTDYKGDPSSALLEVLDPEQNTAFHDNYLDVDFDLSKVLFIATANNLNTIPRPLLDRMELIEVSGYTQEEKVEIADRHLVRKELENHGLTPEQFVLTKPVLQFLIDKYTRESGVRSLDRQIASLMRKVAKRVASGEAYNVELTRQDIEEYLGKPRYSSDKYDHRVEHQQEQVAQAHPHRQPGRRDEGVGRPGTRIRQVARRPAGHPVRHLRRGERTHPCARGGDTQGRPLGGYHHGHGPGVGLHQAQGAPQRGHDRRNHPARQGAARGRHQGEDTRRQACRHHRHRAVCRQPQGHRGNQEAIPQRVEVPLRHRHHGSDRLRRAEEVTCIYMYY